jgi:hypothetical protein
MRFLSYMVVRLSLEELGAACLTVMVVDRSIRRWGAVAVFGKRRKGNDDSCR